MRRLLLLIAALLVVPLAGCGLFGSHPQDAAAAFLAAVARGDAAGAGRLTDDPAAATNLIQQVRDELKPQRVTLTLGDIRSGDNTASASFSAVWDLGMGREWRYPGAFDLVPAHTDEGWSVRWSPAVLH
ncbi:MAG TPA: NTF2-like N-terminal transpeptidase domain-containing protein, partial [Pseudonocardiaceae bacterium]